MGEGFSVLFLISFKKCIDDQKIFFLYKRPTSLSKIIQENLKKNTLQYGPARVSIHVCRKKKMLDEIKKKYLKILTTTNLPSLAATDL